MRRRVTRRLIRIQAVCKSTNVYTKDWGVCSKLGAPRAGLLTFEHQTGRGCFEMGEWEYDTAEDIIQEMVDEWKWDNN